MRALALAGGLLAVVLLVSGCGTTYTWRPQVPEARRSVVVPTFRNESGLPELGATVTRQILREFQREGTFRLESADDAALEVQGVMLSADQVNVAFDRRGSRKNANQLDVKARITVVDRRAQKVLVNNRIYSGSATYASGLDTLSARRDAAGRAADDLSRKVVDDILNLKW